MRDLTHALDDLREDLARTQAGITIVERATRQLAMMIDRLGSEEKDSLRRRELKGISDRLSIARVNQSTIGRFMEEYRRERDARPDYAEETANALGAFDALVRVANRAAGSEPDAQGA